MRILYHHRTRGRHVEGVHIRGVVNALRELGHQVQVISFPGADPEHEQSPKAAPPGAGRLAAAVAQLPGVVFEMAELGYNAITLLRVNKAMRTFRPELIYERYSLFLWATVWLARKRGVPIVLEINDSALVHRVRPLRLKGWSRRIERWCMHNCTGLVFISSYFRDQAVAAYGDIAPSVVSPNATDTTRFDPARFDRQRLRNERGIADRVVCGHVGAFAHWHGMAALVEAIAPRMHEQPELTLLLVGDGVDFDAVRHTAASHGLDQRILLPGRVPHEEIPAWIACMDYAILPDSNEYGSPMKLFEFMAMGVGVVAPDYAPVVEVIEDGKTGWLFPHRNMAACVEQVLALTNRRAEQSYIGMAAREHIVRARQWRNNAEQILGLMPARANP